MCIMYAGPAWQGRHWQAGGAQRTDGAGRGEDLHLRFGGTDR